MAKITKQINLPGLHAAQRKIYNNVRRRNVIVCGRRFGKNILLRELALTVAVGGGFVGWGAPVYRQMMDDYRELIAVMGDAVKRASASEMRIETVKNGVIDFYSLDSERAANTIRGRRYHRFIVNEAADVPRLLDVRNYVIMPTLIDYQGDEYYSGTPNGLNGFFTLFSQTGEGWARWQMPSYKNPHIPRGELDELKNIMTERAFNQEIMAQFIEDGGGVFRNIRAVSTLSPIERGESGRDYVVGVDWGRSNDATVFSVIDVAGRRQVHIDRMTDTDYATQRARLIALAERFNNARVIAESNSMGEPNIEALVSAGLRVTPFVTTSATKTNIIQALALALERGDVALLNDDVQINELTAYQEVKLPSGLLRYSAPEGLHDDTVMALALAWSGMHDAARVFW